ncbi:MAG: Smr/MutS family protein [Bryobacteraceae bacterium]|nr:Smr/MutS family protein [Bryobacteraceae bacterium]
MSSPADETPFGEPVPLEIRDVLDLHAFAPRDAKAALEAWLEEVHARGFRWVRVIHGRGIGVQREMVRRVLARCPYVESFSDAPPEAGGWGATVITLRGGCADAERPAPPG